MELLYYIGQWDNPYRNLAAEKHLMDTAKPNTCTMILWQNHNTVVIGRNQNPWSECRTGLLDEEGVYLARRYSGGGAVYHDMGNLNFSFICKETDYDQTLQFQVILNACRRCGIEAYPSGRNDLLADGKKFSGNAFFHQGDVACHHGTLMIRSKYEMLSRYLTPSKAKLQAKGVSSVRSRVTNLSEFQSDLTVETMKAHLVAAFSEVYGGIAKPIALSKEDLSAIDAIAVALEDPKWIYGTHPPMSCTVEGQFPWGGIELSLGVENGSVCGVNVYTDSLDWTLSQTLEKAIMGCTFRKDALESCIKSAVSQEIYEDIASIIDI